MSAAFLRGALFIAAAAGLTACATNPQEYNGLRRDEEGLVPGGGGDVDEPGGDPIEGGGEHPEPVKGDGDDGKPGELSNPQQCFMDNDGDGYYDCSYAPNVQLKSICQGVISERIPVEQCDPNDNDDSLPEQSVGGHNPGDPIKEPEGKDPPVNEFDPQQCLIDGDDDGFLNCSLEGLDERCEEVIDQSIPAEECDIDDGDKQVTNVIEDPFNPQQCLVDGDDDGFINCAAPNLDARCDDTLTHHQNSGLCDLDDTSGVVTNVRPDPFDPEVECRLTTDADNDGLYSCNPGSFDARCADTLAAHQAAGRCDADDAFNPAVACQADEDVDQDGLFNCSPQNFDARCAPALAEQERLGLCDDDDGFNPAVACQVSEDADGDQLLNCNPDDFDARCAPVLNQHQSDGVCDDDDSFNVAQQCVVDQDADEDGLLNCSAENFDARCGDVLADLQAAGECDDDDNFNFAVACRVSEDADEDGLLNCNAENFDARCEDELAQHRAQGVCDDDDTFNLEVACRVSEDADEDGLLNCDAENFDARCGDVLAQHQADGECDPDDNFNIAQQCVVNEDADGDQLFNCDPANFNALCADVLEDHQAQGVCDDDDNFNADVACLVDADEDEFYSCVADDLDPRCEETLASLQADDLCDLDDTNENIGNVEPEDPIRHLFDGGDREIPSSQLTTITGAQTLAIGDFNADGYLDVLTTNAVMGTAMFVLGSEDRWEPTVVEHDDGSVEVVGKEIVLPDDADVVLDANMDILGGFAEVSAQHVYDDDGSLLWSNAWIGASGYDSFDENWNVGEQRGGYLVLQGGSGLLAGRPGDEQVEQHVDRALLESEEQLRDLDARFMRGQPLDGLGNLPVDFPGDITGDGRENALFRPTDLVTCNVTDINTEDTIFEEGQILHQYTDRVLQRDYCEKPSFADVTGNGHKDMVSVNVNRMKIVIGQEETPRVLDFSNPQGFQQINVIGNVQGHENGSRLDGPLMVTDLNNDGVPDITVVARSEDVTNADGDIIADAGEVYTIDGAGLRAALAAGDIEAVDVGAVPEEEALRVTYTIDEFMALTGGLILQGDQAGGQVGHAGLASVPNPDGTKSLLVGAQQYNNANGCGFAVNQPLRGSETRSIATAENSVEGAANAQLGKSVTTANLDGYKAIFRDANHTLTLVPAE